MKIESPLSGDHGWLILALLVIAVDLSARESETLSEALWRYRKRHPALAHFVVLATALHLLAGDHPEFRKFDVFKLIGLSRRIVKGAL